MTTACALCEALAAELNRLEAIHKIAVWQLEDGKKPGERVGEDQLNRLKLAELEAKLDCARAMLALHEHEQSHGAAAAEPA